MTYKEGRLIAFVAATTSTHTGLVRALGNHLLMDYGLPTFPLAATQEQIRVIEGEILTRIPRENA